MRMGGKIKSVKFKWTAFLAVLLVSNLIVIGVLTLGGIRQNQIHTYEKLLMENSRISNLYIRESYVSEGYQKRYEADGGKEIGDIESFFKKESYSLSSEIRKMTHLPVALYDMEGKLLDASFKEPMEGYESSLLSRALEDEMVYSKKDDEIAYFAPVYGFEKQIGAISFIYSCREERLFYEGIRQLFLKIAVFSLAATGAIGTLYFSRVASKIEKLKADVKSIEAGSYDIERRMESKDEIEELEGGIVYAASRIQEEMDSLFEEKEKLELAVSKLRELETKQKSFIGDITHEFKTPLTVISAQIDLMNMYRDDQDMCVYAKGIAKKEIERLDSMVSKSLYLSKLEKYEFEKKFEDIDMSDLVLDVCSRMEGKASKYDIDIIAELADWKIKADREQMVQVMVNLIDNAIKYNNPGGQIFVRTLESAQARIIEVEDTGIGIKSEDAKRIFEPFYVVDKNRSKKFSGTGLGLSLVKRMVEDHGGRIEARPKKRGSLFRIVFDN